MSLTVGIIKAAIQEAEKCTTARERTGAIIFNSKRILARGHNNIRGNSISPKYKHYMNAYHAEQCCLMHTNWDEFFNASILVIRINFQGELRYSKPCDMCTKLIQHVGIKNVYYVDRNSQIIHEKWK